MGKFRQLSPELWPLIDVKTYFPFSILSIFGVDIRKECFGIVDG